MRAFVAVFEREVVERRLLFAAALLLGLVPLVAPWIPGLAQRGGPELRSAMALIVALCFSFGLAVILGASIITSDLAERRLGFYFSRPIPGWAVWAGKLAAAAGLALCVGALILLPSSLMDGRLQLGGWWNAPLSNNSTSALLWMAVVLFLVTLGHAASLALRSRSPWLILDLAGLGVTSWLAWAAVRRLAMAEAFGAVSLAVTALAALVLVALLAAGATQVLAGRTDIRRGHRMLSLTLCGALLAASLCAQAYAYWVRAVEPSDLEQFEVAETAPRGSWIIIHGEARHRAGYTPTFLLDTTSGRFERIVTFLPDFWTTSRFSADGRWAVWLEPRGTSYWAGPFELVRMGLRHPRGYLERTAMTYSRIPSRLALTADGRRAAVAIGRRLTVEEIPSGRLLASAELPRDLAHYGDFLLFADPGRIRVYGGALFSGGQVGLEPALEIGEMRLAGGGLERIARVEGVEGFQVSRDGTRILARRDSDGRVVVLDAGTGAVMAELPSAGSRPRATFLADGRIALVTGSPDRELRIFSRQLAPERIFRFAGGSLWLGGQPAPDRLIVAAAPRVSAKAQWDRGQVLLLDLATGSTRRLGSGLRPVAPPRIGPESAGSTLFRRGESGPLVQMDPATGRERIVVGSAG